jgi:ubiquinone/menaquinone biosynthesis C-methylase UbiE
MRDFEHMDEMVWSQPLNRSASVDHGSGILEGSSAQLPYTVQRIEFWNSFASEIDRWASIRENYQRPLRHIYQSLVPPGMRVLELGCGQGDLLTSLQPSYGVGVDFSGEMIARARGRHPECRFMQADVHSLHLDESFD